MLDNHIFIICNNGKKNKPKSHNTVGFELEKSHFYVPTGSKCTTSSARTAESVKSCAISVYHLNSARTLFSASVLLGAWLASSLIWTATDVILGLMTGMNVLALLVLAPVLRQREKSASPEKEFLRVH